jgi:DNA-binding XRE family transcriptional regulator
VPVSKNRHNLARLRKHLGLTQADVARLVNCAITTIQSIEVRRLALGGELARKLGAVFGVEPGWLLLNDLDSPVPELAKSEQKRQLTDLDTVATKEQLALAFKILDQLPDRKALMLFKHFTNEFIFAITANFVPRYGSRLPQTEALEYIKASVSDALKAQRRTRPSVSRSDQRKTQP